MSGSSGHPWAGQPILRGARESVAIWWYFFQKGDSFENGQAVREPMSSMSIYRGEPVRLFVHARLALESGFSQGPVKC